ncbi:hypothetical protein [Ruegeria sp. R14_0]|uniref:hypothetical protein n=1 Tax=Ruegeria sp. R14_0 TaxID=2821100 RepID=UPI001ADB7D67|nr:hypothetical protein [Ruegeria sp. R14_0]MBO9448548.1 hypothetical protein [Ruegeria sp. R14_0]
MVQIKAQKNLGTGALLDEMDAELTLILDRQIAQLEKQIEQTIANINALQETPFIL